MNYEQAWEYLDNLQFFKIKLGLKSMNQFLSKIGNPHQELKFVHVGGTNGKGSVSVSLQKVLVNSGYKVGLYTSPHLSSVRERFRVNNSYLDKESFVRNASIIIDTLQGDQITYFEFTTALSFLWFLEQEVDIAIIEVGLGGRLDATNVIIPLVSIITNVSMDHEAYLGNTVEAIAYEKAGIIKDNVSVISGELDHLAGPVIKKKALDNNSPHLLLGQDFTISKTNEGWSYQAIKLPLSQNYNNLELGLKGKYQADNIAIVLATLEILSQYGFEVDSDIVVEALKEVRWPGRLEYFESTFDGGKSNYFLLDGAHNPAGIIALQEFLQNEIKHINIILVWASMADKDISKCIVPIAKLAKSIIFCMPDQNRSARPEQLTNSLPKDDRPKCKSIIDVEEALIEARKLAGENDLILVAGSLYLVGKARSLLCGELICDG